MEWTHETLKVEEGLVWQDRTGWHYRGFHQFATYTGECEATAQIVFNADLDVKGSGIAYGTVAITMLPREWPDAASEPAAVYNGRFVYKVEEFSIVGGHLSATNAAGTEQIEAAEMVQTDGTFLSPVILMEGCTRLLSGLRPPPLPDPLPLPED